MPCHAHTHTCHLAAHHEPAHLLPQKGLEAAECLAECVRPALPVLVREAEVPGAVGLREEDTLEEGLKGQRAAGAHHRRLLLDAYVAAPLLSLPLGSGGGLGGGGGGGRVVQGGLEVEEESLLHGEVLPARRQRGGDLGEGCTA